MDEIEKERLSDSLRYQIQELERAGLLVTQRTNGRFVTDDVAAIARCKKSLGEGLIQDFLAAMTLLGYRRQDIIDLLREEKEETP